MLTSLLIGAIAPHSHRTLSDDHRLAAQYAIDHLDDAPTIDVDVCHHAVGGVDTAGSVLLLGPAELAELDGIVEDRSVPFATSDSDDDDIDFGTILRASRVDASQGIPLYLEAHDESDRDLPHAENGDAMRTMSIIGGKDGLAPTASGGMVELLRHRDPIAIIDFYVL